MTMSVARHRASEEVEGLLVARTCSCGAHESASPESLPTDSGGSGLQLSHTVSLHAAFVVLRVSGAPLRARSHLPPP